MVAFLVITPCRPMPLLLLYCRQGRREGYKYEADTRNHLNLVCSACGKIEDFALELPVPVDLVHKETGFRALETRMEYYGLCRDCNKTR